MGIIEIALFVLFFSPLAFVVLSAMYDHLDN